MSKIIALLPIILLIVTLGISCGGNGNTPTQKIVIPTMIIPTNATITPIPASTSTPSPTQKAGPKMNIDQKKTYIATLKTELGDIVIELNAAKAPITVNNFVTLARNGFYDGTTFHRVLENFMAQGGDPDGSGSGGPGYNIKDEFTDLSHERGVISMANTGLPNTGGSQFFITYVPTPHLDGKHAVFGKVTGGMDVVDSLKPRDPSSNPSFKGTTVSVVSIQEE